MQEHAVAVAGTLVLLSGVKQSKLTEVVKRARQVDLEAIWATLISLVVIMEPHGGHQDFQVLVTLPRADIQGSQFRGDRDKVWMRCSRPASW